MIAATPSVQTQHAEGRTSGGTGPGRARADIGADVDRLLAELVLLFAELNDRRPEPGRLTVRQLRVATLAAGTPLTCREIGDRLSLDEDQVKCALRWAYRRLGITRRTQLAAALKSTGAEVGS